MKELGIEYVPPPPPEFYSTRATDAIHVFFEAFGWDTEDWSMDFKTNGGRFAAFERFGVTNDPRPPWTEAIKNEFAKDPDFAGMTCATAKEKSLAVFSSFEETKRVRNIIVESLPRPVETPLLQRCISCHAEGGKAGATVPYLPLHDPVALKAALNRGSYKRGTLLEEILFRIGPHAIEEEQMPHEEIPVSGKRGIDRVLEEFIDFNSSIQNTAACILNTGVKRVFAIS